MVEALFESQNYWLNLYGLPQLITAVFLLSLTVSILLSEKGSKISWVFTLMTTVATGWLITTSLVLFSSEPQVALTWGRICTVFISFIPFTVLLFAASATKTTSEHRSHLRLSFVWGVIVAVISLATPWMIATSHRYDWGYFSIYGYFAPLLLSNTAYGLTFSLKWLWDHWSDARTESARNRSRMFFLAFCSCAFATVDVFPSFGLDVYPYGFLPVVGFCVILSWGILRYRIIDFSPAYAAEEMMATMDDPLIVCDLSNIVRLVNQACEDVLGFERDELINAPLDRLIASTELGSKKLQALKHGKLETDEEFQFRKSDGDSLAVKLSVSRLTNEDDEPVGIVIVARDITEQKQAQQQIEELAFRDSITNLPNRRYLFQEFSSIVEPYEKTSGALLYLGLPEFNELKHSLGPRKTEKLLKRITARFEGLVEEKVELINWNEDEFVLLDLTVRTEKEARDRGEEWVETLRKPIEIESESFRLRANVGVALRAEHGHELDDLITKADLARNRARNQSGRNVVIYEEGIQERTDKRIKLKNDLRTAIENDQLDLVYHPIISSSSGEVSLLETLLRWEHPKEGFVPPPKVISLAEELNLISQLGDWIFRQACRDLAQIRKDLGDYDLQLSINLSASQLQFHDRILDAINDEVSRNGVAPNDLIFEVTETTAMEDIDFSRNVLTSIQEMGCSVAVDDFGTGHSSIQYLMTLPIDTLKIDKSFILDLYENRENRILVETMLFMAHQLDLTVIAEGVETERHRDFLVQNGCNYLQGFLWTKPLPVQECVNFLDDWSGKEVTA